MALPAMAADGSDVVVVEGLAPVLGMAGLSGEILPIRRGLRGFRRATKLLRRRRYGEGVLLTPSFSSAWLFRCGAVRRLRGTSTDGRSFLLRDRVPSERLRGRHRSLQYRMLLGQPAGGPPCRHPLRAPPGVIARWRAGLRPAGARLVAIFPGSRAPARRWPVRRFAGVAKALRQDGLTVVVLGGPEERAWTARVTDTAPGALDLGGATDLVDLVAVLSLCDLLVTNDTGPMHLAGAVGAATLTLWGPSDPEEVAPVGGRDVRISGPRLPCIPCRRNVCPRFGRGEVLRRARGECMALIEEERVIDAARSVLRREAA